MVVLANGNVDGSNAADLIDQNYVDAEGESIKDDSAVQDIVHGNDGDDKIYLQRGNDIAFGGAGNDEIYGMRGNNELHGGSGDDKLFTGRQTSELFGDAGDDHLVADLLKGGDHKLTGGSGNDTFELVRFSNTKTSNVVVKDFTFGEDMIVIGDLAYSSAANFAGYSVTANGNGDAVIQLNDDDTLTLEGINADLFSGFTHVPNGVINGTDGDDFIGLAYTDADGETVTNDASIGDVVMAGAGNDIVYTHDGDDIVHGGAGNDKLYGGKGDDKLYGDSGDDQIFGYGGDDIIRGGAGNDILKGYAGEDNIRGGSDDDVLYGYADDDMLYGDRGNDMLYGGQGNDRLYAIEGNDTLNGDAGNDYLHSGQNTSVLNGGSGDDRLVARLDKGAEHTLTGGADKDTFVMNHATTDATSHIVITDFNVSDDTLVIGNKTIDPGSLPSGVTISQNAGGDTVVHFSDDETVTLTGVSNAVFTGGAVGNGIIDGTTGNDLINSSYVDAQGEQYTANPNANIAVDAGAGNDTVHLQMGDDTAFGGAGNDTIIGYGGDDKLYGGEGNDTLIGYGGDDYLGGADGNDILKGYAGNDEIRGGAGDDVIHGYADDDLLFGDRGNDTIHGGTGDDTIYGIVGNNELRGNIGDDMIYSGRDTSSLFGGGGDDTLSALLVDGADHTLEGGAGSDKFIMKDASGSNTSNVTINDYMVGVDSLTIGETLINGAELPSGVTASQNADGDTVVQFSDDETVTLKGVPLANFTSTTSPAAAAPASANSAQGLMEDLQNDAAQDAADANAQAESSADEDGGEDDDATSMF